MLFEGAGEGILMLAAEGDNAGQIEAANTAAAEMHYYTVEEMLTLTIKDLDTPDVAAEVPGRMKRILNGERLNFEVKHRRKDGTIFPLEVSAGLLELSGHKYILTFERDITERKLAEEQFLRTEQMVVCGEVTTGLAHEIKNPLAGIKGAMQLFSETAKLSDPERNILQMAVREIKRIESLIRDILNFAKPPKPQFSSVDINSLLDSVLAFSLQSISSLSNSAGPLNIVKDFDSHLPHILSDSMQLNQSFLNLILNAAEDMTEGGTLTVKTSYNVSENSIQVIISDTGKGIEKELIEEIFNPFFTTKPKGTGLGLPITKRLIEQHGGSISFKNNPDRGAAFTVSLPVKQGKGAQSA